MESEAHHPNDDLQTKHDHDKSHVVTIAQTVQRHHQGTDRHGA